MQVHLCYKSPIVTLTVTLVAIPKILSDMQYCHITGTYVLDC